MRLASKINPIISPRINSRRHKKNKLKTQPTTLRKPPFLIKKQLTTFKKQPTTQPTTLRKQPFLIKKQLTTFRKQPTTLKKKSFLIKKQPTALKEQSATLKKKIIEVPLKLVKYIPWPKELKFQKHDRMITG